MPGTTRYSATFDRTYEEEAKPSSPPNARRSRSQSWQANSGHDGRQYTPFASRSPGPRSSSTDNNPIKSTEPITFIPTRTAKTSVKAHNNPFQFVKVGTCPLYKKAEEQLKKAKEIKKPDVLKEEEEEWQSNLDSWKSRRRKMSEDVFRRQEELKLLELEEQIAQVSQKKTKTFSEMVESRATRGRALSLCLLTSPLEFQNWEYENKTHKNGSCSYTDESGENSTVNSEDEGVSVRGRHGETSLNQNEINHRTNGDAHTEQNGSKLDIQNGNSNKLPSDNQIKPKENSYIDSGLESISSSHRAGDTPDSGSDFSQDSNSSIDCDSPRTGVNVLEEFSSKSSQASERKEIAIKLNLDEKGQDFGFTFLGGKDEGQVIIASILEGSRAESSGLHLGDRIITIDGCDVNSKKHIEIAALLQKGREKGQINLLLWRLTKVANGTNGFNGEQKENKVITDENRNAKSYEKSIESENEMYVDDFEELKRQSELLTNKKSDTVGINTQGVYALNVDPNHISQDGNSTNSLFPLSPVTELPSPADETKTLSSSLSPNNTLSVSNSQNEISDDRKKKTPELKLDIPAAQEKCSAQSTSPKAENKKSPAPHTGLKNAENKTQLNSENKSENANASILSTKDKDSQDEKSKSQLSPKKVKSNKLKKVVTSENALVALESTKESPSTANISTTTSKTVIQEKPQSEPKSSQPLDNKQSNNKNSVENIKVSESMENDFVSSENISVPSASETRPIPVKTLESNNAITNVPKVITNNVEISASNKESKTMISDDNKPKKNIQKKAIGKPKVIASENTSAALENKKESPSTSKISTITSKTVIQEKPQSEPKSSQPSDNKQSNNKNSVENIKVSESMENGFITPENTSVLSATEIRPITVKTLESNNAVANVPKVITNNVEISASNKESKAMISDDNKSRKNIQKKAIGKPKVVASENTSAALESTKESPSSSKISTIISKAIVQEKPFSESQSSQSLDNKQSDIQNGVENIKVSEAMEKGFTSSENTTVLPTIETVPVLIKTLESNNTVANVPKVASNNVEISTSNKESKTLISEENKPKKNVQKKTIAKSKDNTTKKNSSISTDVALNEIYSTKEQKSPSVMEKQEKMSFKSETTVSPLKEEKNDSSNGIVNTSQEMKPSTVKEDSPIPCPSINKVRDLTLKFGEKNSVNSESLLPAKNAKSINTPLSEKPKSAVVAKKGDAKAKENSVEQNFTNSTPVTSISSVSNASDSSPKNITVPVKDKQVKTETKNELTNTSSKRSANSQKVNTSAKPNEESKNSNDSLNVVFQSQPKNISSENLVNNNTNLENNNNKASISTDLVPDVPPVDKIAEEMEKLILEQLEEEERAKELSSGKISVESSPEHLLTAPPRLAEPPKEKPPPPPSNEGNPKESSLKRVNSTKRIKKEIHKRRSNFLGIENADESIICSEPSVPPPPALEEILKAEMELDRQTRLRIENEATERLTLEEKEIMKKEREIIESIESEERQKMYLNGIQDCNNITMSNTVSEAVCEQNRIESLKSERKRLDTERHLNGDQQQILLEEKQLKEREEFIRQQEASISTVPLSDSSLSVSANTANNFKKPALSSVPSEAQSNGLLFGSNGDGLTLSSAEMSVNETSKSDKKIKASEKPAVPPKPLKKKEAIRKERERLRQEQEALQREREEHRRKLMLEQEELMKHQKTHAPDAPASRLGPHPPHVQPSFPPQLTTTINATPNARENASFPSRSHHGTSNNAAGSINTVELMGPPIVRQRLPPPRKAVQNEAWGQQKMPSVCKQNQESLTESRYNQNHWLIQEAEMRRIAELKERQRTTQPPCTQTHLAEDDVCSNPPRVPVISPTHNPHLNYPVQEKVWNYGQSNMPLKKYPPPVVKEPPLHTIYPRETVPQQPPTKPSRVVPSERQEQMLSVSGRKRCSHCNEELGRGAAMIIESLQLYYHIHCFQCCVCQAQLGNGSCGTDVRVRNNKLHCHNCYSNDEAGLKFSQV